jgi:hypothetical protein
MGRLEGASEERSEPMLVLTGEAVEVIRGIVEIEDGAGGRSGLRITTEELSAEEAELNMTVSPRRPRTATRRSSRTASAST